MSYTPHTWVNNETITAAKLNNIEEGISEAAQSGGSGALICEWDNLTGALDKTVNEIYSALLAGTPVYLRNVDGTPEESYTSNTRLLPVLEVYTYNYGDVIRVAASNSTSIGVSTSGVDYCPFAPCRTIFSADSLSDYPTYYATVMPNASTAV